MRMSAKTRPVRPTTAGYPRASSSRNAVPLASAAQKQTQPMRSAAKLPEVDTFISMNSLSISEVPSRGRNAQAKGVKEQNYVSQPAHLLSSQHLKPTFY